VFSSLQQDLYRYVLVLKITVKLIEALDVVYVWPSVMESLERVQYVVIFIRLTDVFMLFYVNLMSIISCFVVSCRIG